jgi:hypothetical protein
MQIWSECDILRLPLNKRKNRRSPSLREKKSRRGKRKRKERRRKNRFRFGIRRKEMGKKLLCAQVLRWCGY